MADRLKFNNDHSVVSRLRLTLGFIVLMLCASYLVGGYLLNDLKNSQQNAIEDSVPALSQAHEFESELVSISELTSMLRGVSNVSTAISLRVSLLAHKNHLRDIIDSSTIKSGADDLQDSVRSLETSSRGVVSSKLNMIWLDDSMQAKLVRLTEIREEFDGWLDPVLQAEEAAVAALLDTDVINLAAADFRTRGLTGRSSGRNQLLEISYGLSTLIDLINNLATSRFVNNQNKTILSIKSQITDIGQVLANIADSDTRRALAKMIVELRALTVGDQGIIDSIVRYGEHKAQFRQNRRIILDQISTISDKIDRIVFNTEQDVKSTATKFNNTLSRIVLILGIFGLGVLGIIALVKVIVVERQINSRMRRLTSAVTDIAGGEHGRKVDVSGGDEIGTMAGALEIFKENAKELQRSNVELEQFAYAASHDLKSPLRAIESLARWTLEDGGDELPIYAKDNLEKLLVRAHRLSQLQSDLLEYSKVGKPDDSVEEIDFVRMVEDLAGILDPDKYFNISVARAPIGLSTQIVPLRQILLNLITNAMKHHDLESGAIEIAVDAVGDRLRISIADDGPGIATEYHERIFGLFEKLESNDKVEGSGLGLSMVKKMIERSNCSIAVVSDPSKQRGTTFIFDWPIAESYLMPEKLAVGF